MKKRKQLAVICRKDKRQDEEEMRQAFRVFDKDSSGYIDANDLRTTMRELGVELTPGDVRAMMHEAGVKADGRIYYEGQSMYLIHWPACAMGYMAETEMTSFWWNFRHWLHRKLSFDNFRCSQWRKFQWYIL